MTAHELARLLLTSPDMRVLTLDGDGELDDDVLVEPRSVRKDTAIGWVFTYEDHPEAEQVIVL